MITPAGLSFSAPAETTTAGRRPDCSLSDRFTEVDQPDLALACQTLAEAAHPDPEDQSQRDEVRKQITALDRELDGYRAIVRNEPDAAATVGRWIAETAQKRRRLETFLGVKSTTALTKDDIKTLVARLRDITATLAGADPADKAAVYDEMGIDVTYHPEGRVSVEMSPRGVNVRVGGPIPMLTTRPAPLARSYAVTA
jgi:site-specific DNA recombinase